MSLIFAYISSPPWNYDHLSTYTVFHLRLRLPNTTSQQENNYTSIYLKMSVIAVAGGTGNVGRTIVETLATSPSYRVIVLGRKVRRYSWL